MRLTFLGSERRRPATRARARDRPGIDRFGASISVVVLAAAAAAVLRGAAEPRRSRLQARRECRASRNDRRGHLQIA